MFKKLFFRLETLCFGKWKTQSPTVIPVDNTIVELGRAQHFKFQDLRSFRFSVTVLRVKHRHTQTQTHGDCYIVAGCNNNSLF